MEHQGFKLFQSGMMPLLPRCPESFIARSSVQKIRDFPGSLHRSLAMQNMKK